MAIRIPTYERHVQLDSGAQTIPRYQADLSIGKGLKEAGSEMSRIAAHWKAKQDGFESLQYKQQTALLHQQITQIVAEETARYNPLTEKPGVLNERINARVAPLVQSYTQNAPPTKQREAQQTGDYLAKNGQNTGVHNEQTKRNTAIVEQIDKEFGMIRAGLEKNPDAHPGSVEQVDRILDQYKALGNLTDQQIKDMRKAGLMGIGQSVQKGYADQGRNQEGDVFIKNFAKDRRAEDTAAAQKVAEDLKNKVVPGPGAAAPKPVEPGNIDTTKQPQVATKDAQGRPGTATVRSITIEEDGKHVLIPTVSSDGRIMSNAEAIQRYKDTNEHLGKYGSASDATAAGKALSSSEQQRIAPGVPLPPERPSGATQQRSDTGEQPVQMAAFSQDIQAKAPALQGGQQAEAPPATDQRVTAGEARPVNDTGYDQKAIAAIDRLPKISAAIEKVATETGMDANLMKVAAYIESSGRPNLSTGKHHGLFQLTEAEMGLHGKVADIKDPEANARAFVDVLQRNAGLLKKEIGREPTAEELYLSHNQGVGGTVAHIKNPDQPAWKTMLATSEGQAKGEAWAKAAVAGNIPGPLFRKLYDGDVNKVSSSDLMAIKGNQVSGGDPEFAVAMRRDAVEPTPPKTIRVASMDGNFVASDAKPSFVGGVNIGAPVMPEQYANLPGYRTGGSTVQPGGVVTVDPSGAHGYTGRGRLSGINVAPWLVDSVEQASKTLPEGYKAKIISTVDERDTGTVWHPTGRAIDIQIVDPQGRNVPNLGGPEKPGWALYENMAAAAKAYAQDKYQQKMTWGGHFNTGTPYDRMHFQVGGSSARDFTPAQVEQGRQTMARIQLAGAQPSPNTTAGPGGDWDRWEQNQTTKNDGSAMKATQLRTAMTESLRAKVKDDINWTKGNGEGQTLSSGMQNYYKTPKLTYELIQNHLGTPAAEDWQEQKNYAQKYYEGTKDMATMSNEVIAKQLAAHEPGKVQGMNSDQQKALYNEMSERAKQIAKDRESDPGGYVLKYADNVKAAYDDAMKNPTDMAKAKAYVDASIAAQGELGIPDHKQSPITNDQARGLAMPLRNLADPDPAKTAAKQQVAVNVWNIAGGDPALATKTLQRVLEQGKIQKDVAQQTALTMAQIQINKNNAIAAQTKTAADKAEADRLLDVRQRENAQSGLPGYDVWRPSQPPPRGPITNSDVFGEHGAFDPENTLILRRDMEKLLENQKNPAAQEDFNITYGGGAAEHVIRGGNVKTDTPYEPPPAAAPAAAPPAFEWPQPETGDLTDENAPGGVP